MQRLSVPSFVLILLTVAAACRANEAVPPGLEGVPNVVAEVNGRPIYRQDLIRELVGAAAPQAIDRLIRRTLIEQAAKASQITVTPEEIEQQYAVDLNELKAELISMPWDQKKGFPIADIIRARYAMSIDEYKKLVVRQRLLTKKCVARDLQPTEDQLMKYFASHLDEFQPPASYRASHILISWFDPRDFHRGYRFRSSAYQKAEYEQERLRRIRLKRDEKLEYKDSVDELEPLVGQARKKAEKILKDIRGGLITWEQAVRQYSQDPLDKSRIDPKTNRRVASEREKMNALPGDVGWFHARGPLEPDFYKGAKDLKPGEMTGPVETIYGFHLIKMLEVKAAVPVTYEQVRDKVLRAYEENEIRTRSIAWMDDLMDKAVLKTERTMLWPPLSERAAVIPDANAPKAADADGDPIVGQVNDTALRRSDVWRELLRSESDEALDRLISYEMITTMLKTLGAERMDWECSDPRQRAAQAPPPRPLNVSIELVDLELNDDRLRKEKEAPDMPFKDYIYLYYGQTVDDYRKKLEAGLLLRECVKRKVLMASRTRNTVIEEGDRIDQKTLITEYALARESYIEPASYDLSHILIVPSGGMEKADKTAMLGAVNIIEEVRRSYLSNPIAANWAKLVRDFSMDSAANKARAGRLPPTYPDGRNPDYPEGPAIYAEVKRQALQRGQVSAPFRTFRGYHIVLVDGVHPARQLEFHEVRDRVERDYLQERAKMYVDVWLRGLTSAAKIRRFYSSSGLAPDAGQSSIPDKFDLPKN
ncbi:MAG TPA: peptidylprolyl isomerase [Planctomycetota bacterium]|nr:peptidylprolyl isomerase [Planctomycetota bacterium]